jgi:ubiquinone/menaquinone biosynthesis C-methylase UbiE
MEDNNKFYKEVYEALYTEANYDPNITPDNWKETFPDLYTEIEKSCKNGSKILDIGCSRGSCVQILKDLGHDAYGIDTSKFATDEAKKRGLNCQEASATDIPFAENEFEYLVCTDVMEHFFLEDIPKAISEMRRVLKDGGELFTRIAIRTEYNSHSLDYLHSIGKFNDVKELHLSIHSMGEWITFFKDFGFTERILCSDPWVDIIFTKNAE